ncbi:unnamed protein product [Ceratitis capitata]|uniref:(Mediterranean fruit fly) hypothetical protein n=1 Tax=Ceratitis capitata TaxID=7213 RepID=A0A811ULB8_CERCA|nr:unnamed protein product [Ceratitis capitata]
MQQTNYDDTKAVVLVYADANGFAESAELRGTAEEVATARTTTTTARSSVALVGAAAAASEEAAEGGQAEQAQLEAKKVQSIPAGKESSGVEAKTAQLEIPTRAANQGLSTTTIATTKNTTTTTTTSSSSSSNDKSSSSSNRKNHDISILKCARYINDNKRCGRTSFEHRSNTSSRSTINDEPAKPQKQAQAERVEVVGSSFIKADAGERPTIATKSLSTTKINAAVQVESRVTPQVASTHDGGSSAATKITEAPTVNFESKSRADTEPLKTDYGTIAVAKQQEASRGNVAKTQIIKNEKECVQSA